MGGVCKSSLGREDAALTPVGRAGGALRSALVALDRTHQGRFLVNRRDPLTVVRQDHVSLDFLRGHL